MIIKRMLSKQEQEMQEIINNENKSYNEIFKVLEYYVFNFNKIKNKKEIDQNIQDLSLRLLRNIENIAEEMLEDGLEDENYHEYINRLDFIIKYLPKEVDIQTLIQVKNILEEDFERVSEPMTIEK